MPLFSLTTVLHAKGNTFVPFRNVYLNSNTVFSGGSFIMRHLYSGKSTQKPINDRLHKLINKSRLLTRLNSDPRCASYFNRLSETGPIATVTSFLILHEVTAIVPLFGFWWLLYTIDLHAPYELPVYMQELLDRCGESIEKLVGEYDKGWDKERLVVSGAISYAIVKLLYPARVLISLWGAPYFGKLMMFPFSKVKSLFKR